MAISKAQIRASTKYEHNNYEKLTVRFKKGQRDFVRQYADKLGESLNEFAIKAIYERIERME